jgi:hypothetical protein
VLGRHIEFGRFERSNDPNVSYGCELFAVFDADTAPEECDRKNTQLSAGKLVKISTEVVPSFSHKYVLNPVVCCLKNKIDLKRLFLSL